MLYPHEHTLCAHCHQRIRYVTGALGGAWQHVFSMSIYCDQGGDVRAEPS